MRRRTVASSPPIPTCSSARATSRSCGGANCTRSRSTPSAGETTGSAFPITERVDQDPYDDGFALFALSGNGVLIYRGGVTPDRQLRWFDRTGKVLGALDEPGEFRDLAMSRDGTLVAYEQMDAHLGTRDIWVRDLDRDTRLRLTSTPDEDGAPVWAPDGGSLVFGGLRQPADHGPARISGRRPRRAR